MQDWMKPLASRKPVPANRPTYGKNSGSMMVQLELVNELYETESAHLLIFSLGGRNIGRWLPKSQIKIPYADVVEIPRWLVDRILEEMEQWIS